MVYFLVGPLILNLIDKVLNSNFSIQLKPVTSIKNGIIPQPCLLLLLSEQSCVLDTQTGHRNFILLVLIVPLWFDQYSCAQFKICVGSGHY